MLNIVFVGCGAALEYLYRQPLRDMERRGWLQVCGLVDTMNQRASEAAQCFRHAQAFTDLASALDRNRAVDLVIIASPPVFHAAHAAIAFQHNCHVLCEKPMAHSVAAAEEMAEMARERKRLLAIGMARRFYPAIAAAQAWVKENVGATPLVFSYREGSLFDWPIASASQFRRSTGGGGVLIDKGVHALDTLYYLFGKGRVLRSADDASSADGVEASAALDLVFNRARGFLQLSWQMPLNNGFLLASEGSEIWLPISPADAAWVKAKGRNTSWHKLNCRAEWATNLGAKKTMASPANIFDCVRLQLVSVLRSIHFGETPVAPGAEGVEVMRMVMSAYEQAGPLRQPWLPEGEQRALANGHWRSQSDQDGAGILSKAEPKYARPVVR